MKLQLDLIRNNDLGSIRDYIARDSQIYADVLLKKYYRGRKLNVFPEIGRTVNETNDPNIREYNFEKLIPNIWDHLFH